MLEKCGGGRNEKCVQRDKGPDFFFKPSDKSVLETGKEGDGNIKYFWERLVLSLPQRIVSISERKDQGHFRATNTHIMAYPAG